MMEIDFTGNWSLDRNSLFDKTTGASIRICSTLNTARSYFEASARLDKPEDSVIALAVPSVIVPIWNLVIFPQGKGFRKHVALRKVSLFSFDPRLFPEDAILEDAL